MKIVRHILDALRGEQNLDKLLNRGLKVGKNFTRMGNVIIDPSHCWHIEIGDDVTLAPRVHILAHDASTHMYSGYTKVANVRIGSHVFIGASSIILPGVHVGDNVVIGAGSVVTRDIPSGCVAVGNPARVVKSVEEYMTKEKMRMTEDNCFDESCTLRNRDGVSDKQKQEMIMTSNKFGNIYIK